MYKVHQTNFFPFPDLYSGKGLHDWNQVTLYHSWNAATFVAVSLEPTHINTANSMATHSVVWFVHLHKKGYVIYVGLKVLDMPLFNQYLKANSFHMYSYKL